MPDPLERWLALREPVDATARSVSLTRMVADAISAAVAGPAHVLDLATGTGSNLRYLMDKLPASQRWLVVDRNPALLSQVAARTAAWAEARGGEVRADGNECVITGERLECRVEARVLDLGTLDNAEIFAGRHLVTASALLDLVSESWLRALAARCRAAGAAALFAISYDGRCSCSPSEPEDDMVQDLFNRHQLTDKGLGGPAAGPAAAQLAAQIFADVGYHVVSQKSDWELGPRDPDLQRQLIDGWAEASTAIAPGAASTIARWRDRRLEHVDSNRSILVVGHLDMAAWLPAR